MIVSAATDKATQTGTLNPVTPLAKVPTGIKGVDEILEGGLPKGRMTLIIGGPGTGKSLFGLEYLYRSALAGEPGILVAFEERASAIRENAQTLGLDLEPLEKAGTLFLMEAHVNPEMILSGEFSLKALLAILDGQTKKMGATRIVIDAIDVLLRLFADPGRERTELYLVHDWLLDHGMTAILTAKTTVQGGAEARYEFLDFMANTVLWLDARVEGQITTRRLRILKYRGSNFARNEHPYIVARGGIVLIPVSSVALRHQALGPHVSTGLPDLDAIFGGGYRRASCVLIAGTSGTGKTIVAATFVRAACERGEKVLYINFEESQEALVSTMLSPGIDLRPALDNGRMQVMAQMPETTGSEEHLIAAAQRLEDLQPDHVIVDAASSTLRMGTERAAFGYLIRLINLCKNQGRTILLLNQLAGTAGEDLQTISGLGISSIVDAVLVLRQVDSTGELNRLLAVIKSRGSKHSNQFREFRITDHGIEISEVYIGVGGLVTGVIRQQQEAREAAEARQLEQRLRAKQTEIEQMQAGLEAHTADAKARIQMVEAELDALRLEQDIRTQERQVRLGMRRRNE